RRPDPPPVLEPRPAEQRYPGGVQREPRVPHAAPAPTGHRHDPVSHTTEDAVAPGPETIGLSPEITLNLTPLPPCTSLHPPPHSPPTLLSPSPKSHDKRAAKATKETNRRKLP